MMADFWIVKLDADQDEPVLVKVTPVGGNKPLDLDLLATDGDRVFEGKVRTRTLDKLRAKAYHGTDEEWSSILQHALVNSQTADLDAAISKSLQVRCAISGKGSKSVLSISFRTLVQDITQQLGSIELANTKDESGVDLWGWANQLADQRDELKTKATLQEEQAGVEAKNIDAMQKQLDDLIAAKLEHEKDLMAKFAMLLNEKKFELHRLQRVLASARVDPKQLEQLQDNKSGSKRGKKRGATHTADASEEESDAFEEMDVDDKANGDGSDHGGQTTEDETDEGDLDQPVTSQTEAGSRGAESSTKGKGKELATTPPRRELPFTRQKEAALEQKGSTAASGPSNEADEETESEADEL